LVTLALEGRLQHQVLGEVARKHELGRQHEVGALLPRLLAGGPHLGEIARDVADLGIELRQRDLEGIRHNERTYYALHEHYTIYATNEHNSSQARRASLRGTIKLIERGVADTRLSALVRGIAAGRWCCTALGIGATDEGDGRQNPRPFVAL